LSHLAHAGASQSVLTGNTPERARLKVTTAHLADHIDFDSGFYGDLHATRMELVAAAAERLSLQQGVRPIIVGDTPLDILAAHASGFPVIATTTGIFDAVALEEHRPDVVVSDFSDARAFAETITAIVSR
jgi:phosphoglycolate phosphatase-like HAD superfamily hydrolase